MHPSKHVDATGELALETLRRGHGNVYRLTLSSNEMRAFDPEIASWSSSESIAAGGSLLGMLRRIRNLKPSETIVQYDEEISARHGSVNAELLALASGARSRQVALGSEVIRGISFSRAARVVVRKGLPHPVRRLFCMLREPDRKFLVVRFFYISVIGVAYVFFGLSDSLKRR